MDGISDQNPLPAAVAQAWRPAIRYQRFVVPYDVMRHPASRLRRQFEAWYAQIPPGVLPVVSLWFPEGCWPSGCPAPSAAEYAAGLRELLRTHPLVAVVEAWNEPNGAGEVAPQLARSYYDAATAACAVACTVLAGSLVDTPDAGGYLDRYGVPAGAQWAVHPYVAVERRDTRGLDEVARRLPPGAALWFTEIGAYRCDAGGRVLGSVAQEAQARFLVSGLLAAYRPAHTFYYEVMDAAGRDPALDCPDTALYAADGTARPAAGAVTAALHRYW